MGSVVELLSGILRLFPNTIIATLFVVGIATGKISWIFIGVGALLMTVATLVVQYILSKTINFGPMPGAEVMEACSILPTAAGAYTTTPSLWIALSTFLVSYIFINASNIYATKPHRKSQDAISVQQRKGTGLISMLAVCLLFLFLLVPRWNTTCETLIGMLLGAAMGIAGGWIWWKVLDACGPDVYPDIHGVMMGLKPGGLRTGPVACTPASAATMKK
jgi:hypothetical protein